MASKRGMSPPSGTKRPLDHAHCDGHYAEASDEESFNSPAGHSTVKGSITARKDDNHANQSLAKGLGSRSGGEGSNAGSKRAGSRSSSGANWDAPMTSYTQHAGGHGAGSAHPEAFGHQSFDDEQD